MKKLILGLLLLANSLFAVTTSEIMNADPAYHRAFITQVDIRDQYEVATKLNTVSYPHLGAGYPYTNIEYSGNISDWWYTFSNDYYYFYRYSSGWDYYINPADLSVTYIYVNLAGYSQSQVTLYKYVYGQGDVIVPSTTHNGETYPKYMGNGYWVYVDTASSAINFYSVETFIQETDGTVKLGNSVGISRNVGTVNNSVSIW